VRALDLDLAPEVREWRTEVREFLRESVTDELIHEMRTRGIEYPGPEIESFRRKVAARGWNSLTWPKEFGGQGRGEVFAYILQLEFEYWGVPRPDLTVTSIAPMIIRYGTTQNQEEFLPRIAAGELSVAVGYSEPNAGTDLASLRTRAELDGDEWVINGQKIWNSFAHCATHEWLCVRTNPDVPKHRGISVIMVPVDSPGIEIRPLPTWSEHGRTNETFFTDVRVPRTNLIGEVDQGWRYITGALDLERLHLGQMIGEARRVLDEMISWARQNPAGQVDAFHAAAVTRQLVQVDAEVEALLLLGLDAAAQFDSGEIPTIAATTMKIAVTELGQRIADLATQMHGAAGMLSTADPGAPLGGLADEFYRRTPMPRFGGGANEVMREVVVQRGYGMPRSGR
jgi:3-oxocholest-4-en-26-oyl-CoA dehydrogenase alpha subunit